MPIQTLAGNPISSTYQKVVQTDGTYLADGTGSILQTLNITASYASNAFPYTGSAGITGSLYVVGPFTASSAIITGDVIVQGTASINTLVVNQTQLSTGSNQLGDAGDDFQTLYGTVRIPTGSLTVSGSTTITGRPLGGAGVLNINGTSPGSTNGDAYVYFNSNGGSNSYLFQHNQQGGRFYFKKSSVYIWTVSNDSLVVGDTTVAATAKLQVRGSGTTSSTTALLVQNANASSSFYITDTGSAYIANGLTVYGGPTIIGNTSEFYNIRLGGLDQYDSKITLNRMADININVAAWASQAITFTKGYGAPLGKIFQTSNFLIGADGTADNGYRLNLTGSGTAGVFNANNILTISSSLTTATGSFKVIGTQTITGSLAITGSAGSGSALTVYKSGSTVMSIQGSQGELFSITDSLSGSLFSVSNISGLPILEVFSDNTVLLGDYLDPMLITTKRVTANSGSTLIYSLPTASYDGAFFDYTIKSGSNARAGQLFGTYVSTTASYTDNSTTDIGDTSGFTFGFFISGSNMVLTGSALTSGWTVRTIIRSI